jgi:hypothetical protein
MCGVDCAKDLSRCQAPVCVSLSCGHTAQVECHQQHFDLKQIRCTEKCSEKLECGHMCSGDCNGCSGVSILRAKLFLHTLNFTRNGYIKFALKTVGSYWCVDTLASRSVDSSVYAQLDVKHSANIVHVRR